MFSLQLPCSFSMITFLFFEIHVITIFVLYIEDSLAMFKSSQHNGGPNWKPAVVQVLSSTPKVTVVAVSVSVIVVVDVSVTSSFKTSRSLGLRSFVERPHGVIGSSISSSLQLRLPDCIVFPMTPSTSWNCIPERPAGSTFDGRMVEMSTVLPLAFVTIASGNIFLASLFE